MKQIRLLPVVIAATLALLLLKGLGIMTGGGYVLTGTSEVQAAGAGGGTEDAQAPSEATLALPVEPTLSDANPELSDGAPTMPMPRPGSGQAGETTDTASAEATAAADGAEEAGTKAPPEKRAGGLSKCPPKGAEGASGEAGDGLDFMQEPVKCIPDPGVNENGDALPLIQDGSGTIKPLAEAGAGPSEDVILGRLSERRAELDALQSELDIRLALVEAAEKRIDERTAALAALEKRIEAMVDEKRALEETQFVSLVAMYETMKPKDAAAIFDELDMPVLLRVARAVNPRKMAPIMAKMNPTKAMELTAGLAVDQVEPTIDMADGENLAALPQIIGQ